MENNSNNTGMYYDPYTNRYVPVNDIYKQNYKQPQNQQLRQYAFVNGIEGAKSYQLQSDQTMMLMDSDNPLCYRKDCDSVGKSSLRYFKLEEIDEKTARGIVQPLPPKPEYASKQDIDKINQRLDELFKKLDKPSKKETKENA